MKAHYNPCLIVLIGPPLHGKTAVGHVLALESNFETYDVDRIKADVLVEAARTRGEVYDFSKGTPPEVLSAIYQMTVDVGRQVLASGLPVVLTGTFSKPEFKAPLLAFMEERKRLAVLGNLAPTRIIRLNVGSYDTIARRIEQRNVEGHPSSIKSREKYEKSLTLASPWPDGVEVTDIDADRPLDEVVADVRSRLTDLVRDLPQD